MTGDPGDLRLHGGSRCYNIVRYQESLTVPLLSLLYRFYSPFLPEMSGSCQDFPLVGDIDVEEAIFPIWGIEIWPP